LQGGGEGGGGEQPLQLSGGARGTGGGGEELGAAGGIGLLVAGVALAHLFAQEGIPGGGKNGVLRFDGAQAQAGEVFGLLGEQEVFGGVEVAGDGAAVEPQGAGDGGDAAALAVEGVDLVTERQGGVGELAFAARAEEVGVAEDGVFVVGVVRVGGVWAEPGIQGRAP
jgi:hypothetical protein